MVQRERLSMYEESYLTWFKNVWGDHPALAAAYHHCVASMGLPNAARLLVKAGAAMVKPS